jgi:hypothetical protein
MTEIKKSTFRIMNFCEVDFVPPSLCSTNVSSNLFKKGEIQCHIFNEIMYETCENISSVQFLIKFAADIVLWHLCVKNMHYLIYGLLLWKIKHNKNWIIWVAVDKTCNCKMSSSLMLVCAVIATDIEHKKL